jgi:Skp family chaperone for outer membrane proteins
MMTIRKTIIAAAALALAGMTTAPAMADTPPAPAAMSSIPQSYAFVDMGRVMHETTAGKTVGDDIIARKKQIKAEIDKKVQSVREQDEALDKQHEKMTKEEFVAKKQEIGKQVDNIRNFSNEKGNAFDAAAGEAMNKVRDFAASKIEEIAQKHKYAAVFSRDAVILGAKDLDITDEVIKAMNDSGEKIAVDWSAKPKKAAE